MFDFKRARIAFEAYLDKYDRDNHMIKLKIIHTYGVVSASEMLAKKLGLDEENIFLAKIIALLHDIGRFEQAKEYSSFEDYKTLDHGILGAKILFDNGYIRDFIISDKYDEIIKTAIVNHNKFKIEDDLKDITLLHTKIIRDADKIDNFRVKANDDFDSIFSREQSELETSLISDNIYNEFMHNKLILSSSRTTAADFWISYLAFIFDLQFRDSFVYIKKLDYVNKIIDRLDFKKKDTREKMEKIRNHANSYIDSKIRESL